MALMRKYSFRNYQLMSSEIEGFSIDGTCIVSEESGIRRAYLTCLDGAQYGAAWGRLHFEYEMDEENVYPIEININRFSDGSGSGGAGLELRDARIDAIGRIDDNGLMIVTGDVDEGYMDQDRNPIYSSIKGVLEQYKEGLRFIVLETDCDSTRPGDNFVMTRM